MTGSGPSTGSGSVRVTLAALDLAGLGALLGGERGGQAWHGEYPMEETFVAGRLTLDGAAEIEPQPWGMYQILEDGEVVGDAGFHGPLGDDGAVEIGYNVVAGRRGHGIATAACAALVSLAWQHGARRVLADTEATNAASQGVLGRAGFTPSATRTETGHLSYAISRP